MKNTISQLITKGWQFLTLLFLITLAVTVAAQVVASGSMQASTSDARDQAASDEVFRQLLYLPAPTPRPQVTDAEEEAQTKRPPGFYDADKAPSDDAPVEDLIDYWSRWANTSGREGRKPSDAVRKRLLAGSESDPEILPHLLPLIPDTPEAAERVKKLYDASQGSTTLDDDWRKSVREWLKFNSKYFLDELLAMVRKVRDKDGSVENDEALSALAKVDPDTAEPMLQALSGGGQPRTAAVALALLYGNARAAKDATAEEKYRARLQMVAADHNAPAHARDTAIETLTLTEWPGRDEWYLSLFEDETLLGMSDGSFGFSPLTYLFARDPEKWIPVMTRLVEGKNQKLRDAAANCLIVFQNHEARKDALRPLLPWLANPDWAKQKWDHRLRLIQSMDFIDLPESVPGLIWVVENDKSEYNRSYAAESLAKYKDPRAVPALKKALAEEKDESHRARIIQGLLACGGMPEAEQVAALEAYAAKLVSPEDRADVERYRSYGDNPLPLTVSVGQYIARQKDAPDTLVRAVLDQAESLRSKTPSQARILLGIAQGWQAKQVDLDMVQRIGTGTADAATIANALARRAKLRESVGPELRSLTALGGSAQGVAAVLLADEALALTILSSSDERAQLTLLACARLTQTALPVAQVGALLRSKNADLSLASERYLLAEDSREAQQLLWEHHPQKAFITGWRENIQFIGGDNFSAMERAEEKLRAELFRTEDAPLEVFALLGNNEQPLRVLRVYPKRAVYTHYEDASRYRERVISSEELSYFKSFVTTNSLRELGPQFGPCHHDCWVSEFLSLNRQAGRRVFSHQGFGGWDTLLANFDLLGHDSKVHYRLEDEIKGLEVLFADEALSVKDVWQRGDDLRVLVEREATAEEIKQEERESSDDDEEDEVAARAEQRRREIERAKARVSWRSFRDTKLGAVTSQPEGYTILDVTAFDIDENDFPSHLNTHLAQATVGSYVVLAGNLGKGGLWKKAAGRKAASISSEGVYANPLLTLDGKWVVAAKAETDWGRPNDVIRFNLKTGREYRVNLSPAEQFEPEAYLSAHGKVLLRRARDENDVREAAGPAAPEFYLLDASTGQTQLVKGVFEPLLQEGNRFLQPTGSPDEFWVAVPDRQKNQTRVGRYSLRDFSLQALLVVPHLIFDSTQMWVDEAGLKLYIIYEGQLLRLPLQSSPQSKVSER